MSLLDEARAVRERIAARLRELEPLVKEYNELRQMAAEMGLEAGEAQTSAGAGQQAPPEPPGEGSSSRPPRVQRGGRSRRGYHARRLCRLLSGGGLAYVRLHHGVGEIGKERRQRLELPGQQARVHDLVNTSHDRFRDQVRRAMSVGELCRLAHHL